MTDVLLVDFGASRVKCALWSAIKSEVIEETEIPAPAPSFGPRGEVEIAPEAYWSAMEATAGRLAAKYPEVEVLWLCSEMHGVIVADREGVPLSPYISWRDGRATAGNAGGPSTFEKLLRQADKFFALSGMKLRPGLPVVSLAHLAGQGVLPRDLRLFTLVDWLLWRGGERHPAIHASLAAGTGLYDVHRQIWSEALFDLAGLTARKIQTAALAPAGSPIGYIELVGRKITVFGGIGDLQAAIFGAGFPVQATMAINLGTGSQVLRASHKLPTGIERRPGANGGEFAAITHIPAGRALNVFANCLDSCAKLGGGEPFFWRRFSGLSSTQVLDASMEVDMNVFSAAWKYERGGSVRFIHEGSFTPDELLAAIAKGWLVQYVSAIEHLDPEREEETFLVSGALGRRAAFVLPVLSSLSKRTARPTDTLTGEETLDGLAALARNCDHVN